MADDDLPRIFERFYRCDRSRSQAGIGLGLSLVKAIVKAFNGEIEVKSAVDKGSIFLIRLPA
jgi:two-component system phosphate regulon sensor histidine kinase PhoR